jgi:hypothetical protein
MTLKRVHLIVLISIALAIATAGCTAGAGSVTEEATAVGRRNAETAPLATYTPIPPTATPEAGTPTPGVGTPSGITPVIPHTAQPEGSYQLPAQVFDTPVPTPTGEPILPSIYAFSIRPQEIEIGGQVYMAWDARGDRAYLCPKTRLGLADTCFDVPLNGSQYVTVHADDQTWDYYGFELHVVANGEEVVQFMPLTVTCQGPGQWWFFRGDPYTTNVPEQCPASRPIESAGAAQRFENGMMIWVEAVGQVIVLYEGGAYQSFGSLPEPSSEAASTGETPPAGLQEPISGFGTLWRGEVAGSEGVREGLGWATEHEVSLKTAYQCYAEGNQPTCFVRGPDGEIIRLSPNGAWSIWPTG